MKATAIRRELFLDSMAGISARIHTVDHTPMPLRYSSVHLKLSLLLSIATSEDQSLGVAGESRCICWWMDGPWWGVGQ